MRIIPLSREPALFRLRPPRRALSSLCAVLSLCLLAAGGGAAHGEQAEDQYRAERKERAARWPQSEECRVAAQWNDTHD